MDHRDKEYKNPTPTVDIIVEYGDHHLVFIERKNDPKGLALPGGFIDEGESAAEAARREAKEELGVDVHLTDQFFTYSDPKRDPRQHVMSTVYIAKVSIETHHGLPSVISPPDHPFVAGDDAKEVQVIHQDDLAVRELTNSSRLRSTDILESLVFDHEEIVLDYFVYKLFGYRPDPK